MDLKTECVLSTINEKMVHTRACEVKEEQIVNDMLCNYGRVYQSQEQCRIRSRQRRTEMM